MTSKYQSQSLGFSDVELVERKRVFSDFFNVDQYCLRHRKFDGTLTQPIERLVFERGHAVAVLPYDPVRDEVVLIEQIRIGAYAAELKSGENASPWLLECIAGMVEAGESDEQVAIREAQEEAGIEISGLEPMVSFYTSPGGSSEKIQLFAAVVDSQTADGVHGLDEEHEDIKVYRVAFDEAVELVKKGRINNAPTVIAIQWLQLNKHRFIERLEPSC